MHPVISYHLTQAHVADLRDRAQRHTLARAARLARRNQRAHAVSRLGVWGRRAQAGLIARMTGVARITIRAYPILTSRSEEGHAVNSD
jgi:hypothetical protein